MRWFLVLLIFPLSFGLRAQGNNASPQHQHIDAVESKIAKVVAVYPSADKIPVNLLRFYIYFSQPMREGQFLDYIRLLDENGKDMTGVFFDNQYELWNEDHTRLTILIDPGRVKTGLSAHEKMGRAFEAGKKYRLSIDQKWPTISGSTLSQSFTKEFSGVAAQMQEIDPDDWIITPPTENTKEPVTIRFEKPMDHIAAERYIVIIDANESLITGEVELAEGETVLRFYPSENWQTTDYQIIINSRLEDIVGNNLNGSFDHKIGTLKSEREGMIETLTLRPLKQKKR